MPAASFTRQVNLVAVTAGSGRAARKAAQGQYKEQAEGGRTCKSDFIVVEDDVECGTEQQALEQTGGCGGEQLRRWGQRL